MSQTSTLLGLPYLDAAQAQKHVTHNEALRKLDAIVQLAVISRNHTSPPPAPEEGDRYIVTDGAGGAWTGHTGHVAAWQDGAWAFFTPVHGWLAWIADEGLLTAWDGSHWVTAASGDSKASPLFGVNTSADAINRLAVKSDAALLSHDDVTPGSGDMRTVINKADVSNTASLLFQTDSSGRAEFGLTGDDDWHVKVSADGANWTETLIADRSTGRVAFPQGLAHAPSGAKLNGLVFTPGGDGITSIYRNDTTRSGNPRTAVLSGKSGDTLTLAASTSSLFFHTFMQGVSYVRIWNTSKAPKQAAWVKAALSGNQLQVIAAGDIASWSSGETIQIGDPTDITPGNVIAFDISPMLQSIFGAVFPQRGIVCKCSLQSATIGDSLALTPSGVPGSFISAAKAVDTVNVWPGLGLTACTMPSPISNSNLVLVQEYAAAGNLGIAIVSSIGVFA